MGEKDPRLLVNDKLGIVIALLKTANMAVGNIEYFGDDGQGIAITLDIASTKLNECQELLGSLNEIVATNDSILS